MEVIGTGRPVLVVLETSLRLTNETAQVLRDQWGKSGVGIKAVVLDPGIKATVICTPETDLGSIPAKDSACSSS